MVGGTQDFQPVGSSSRRFCPGVGSAGSRLEAAPAELKPGRTDPRPETIDCTMMRFPIRTHGDGKRAPALSDPD